MVDTVDIVFNDLHVVQSEILNRHLNIGPFWADSFHLPNTD